ncbi:MAG: glycosyltransferase [Deltaproteobacteria bacterium]|nr:glycosyltransferase [Deltaproteobacteria bacterium]
MTGFSDQGRESTSARIYFDGGFQGVESFAFVNRKWGERLSRYGHVFVHSVDEADVYIHHNYLVDFNIAPPAAPCFKVAVRTSDFGRYPKSWVRQINTHYDQLWVYTRLIHQRAIESGVDPAKIRVIPLGIDPDIFFPDGLCFDLPTRKKFRFLFVGGLVRRKGVDTLLDAYAHAFTPEDDVCLVLKGHSNNRFYQESEFTGRALDMKNDPAAPEVVVLDDHLADDDLASLYRACDVSVFPFRAEGFVIPALESMACGTPTMLPEFGPPLHFSSDLTSYLVPYIHIRAPLKKTYKLKMGWEVDCEEIEICEIRMEALANVMRDAFRASSEDKKAKIDAGLALAHGCFTWTQSALNVHRCLTELMTQ